MCCVLLVDNHMHQIPRGNRAAHPNGHRAVHSETHRAVWKARVPIWARSPVPLWARSAVPHLAGQSPGKLAGNIQVICAQTFGAIRPATLSSRHAFFVLAIASTSF